MIIFRYLAKEVFITLVGLTTILLLIFMSNQFVQYLSRAARGQFPILFVLKLMLLEMPNLMCLLLPLGFYIALIIAYGRLYADSEMTVLKACGYGPLSLLKHSMVMAMLVALFVMLITLWVSPYISVERVKILRSSGLKMLIQTISPGQFRAISGGNKIYYVEKVDRNRNLAENVFLAQFNKKNGEPNWDILWAENAYVKTNTKTNTDYIVLQNVRGYKGIPGKADYQVAELEQYKALIPQTIADPSGDVRTEFTSNLWPPNNTDLKKAAELQWRFSIPLMVLTLTLIGVPLSRVNSRSGKFAKLFPAILVYMVYANFMFVARGWVTDGVIPTWVGVWWLHILFAMLGGGLIWYDRKKLS